ncbi:2-polyprenyl-3-methyl-5-hydroxy-6-metoxy-1,4-benzoquinol methylase [Jatrophihabitans sp. GAS493]|uniref:class I SAM-dependent DNA methyltransferase n=1 Tax=Jatrophihabitans sp. GAS493 TaxID=1907575 RepID=UPI000BB71915|nr:class I SAM-dependent methyltransferase [Jatrophihabitans sp. GAS493]SOD71839.1 2-polyprenyl-3-methyl-5-hydroxy-6-metoxy-1,4-benzoquinol methylase [Jatrophihabitans sp. GAS493]
MTGIDYADTYDPDTDFDRYYTIATSRRIAERITVGDRVLELGCATGLMSSKTLALSAPSCWVGVDRSEVFLDRARQRGLLGARFEVGDLDDLQVGVKRYEHLLATNVLHELADPVEFLRRCSQLLVPGGMIHITLQNPHSIHRLCALEMGLISSLDEISERGSQWGTRGLWGADELQALAERAGLSVAAREGIMLKPLPNSLMSQLPEEVIEGFIRGAVHLPDVAAMTYLVLTNDSQLDSALTDSLVCTDD